MRSRPPHRSATEANDAADPSHRTASDNGIGDIARDVDMKGLRNPMAYDVDLGDVDLGTRHGGSLHASVMWRILTPVIAILAFALGSSVDLGLPHLLGHSSEALTGAAVLGVSIAFTGIVVSGFFLLISRVNALAAADEDVAAARRQVERGEEHATAIRAYLDASKGTSTKNG